MNLKDVLTSKAIASVAFENASNKIPYLGSGLFPAAKKLGLELKWVKTSKGLPVTLKAAAFDAVAPLRSRSGFKIDKTQMAFFREAMEVNEADRQQILLAREGSDPRVTEAIENVYKDANTLIEAADVVPEIMIMQLLNPGADGRPSILLEADGAKYAYDYDDRAGTYASNNYLALSGTSMWSDITNSDPLADVQKAQEDCEAVSGSKQSRMIVSRETMNYLKKNAKIKSAILAQNTTANILMTDARVKEIFLNELGVQIIVYTKQYKDNSGNTQKFFKDGYAALIPDGALGNTWYGTTPEEAGLLGNTGIEVSIVNTGVAVTVFDSVNPVKTETIVSEIVLPSYERMNETYVIKAY